VIFSAVFIFPPVFIFLRCLFSAVGDVGNDGRGASGSDFGGNDGQQIRQSLGC
jgi:hypothetical protein